MMMTHHLTLLPISYSVSYKIFPNEPLCSSISHTLFFKLSYQSLPFILCADASPDEPIDCGNQHKRLLHLNKLELIKPGSAF